MRDFDRDPAINGILVQLPLPTQVNELDLLNCISPEKDVDGLHPFNIGSKRFLINSLRLGLAMKKRTPHFTSCTPLGVLKLIQSVCPNLEGKKVTVCGRSNIVGMPLALLLNKHNATVSLCHTRTSNIKDHLKDADIVVTAAGSPRFFKGDWFKPGSIAIDVGINELIVPDADPNTKRKIVGDIEYEKAIERCSFITPVPGGVGPMTITMLMSNIVDSWEKANF